MSDYVSRDYLLSLANKDGAYGYVSAHEIINAPSVENKLDGRPNGLWKIHDLVRHLYRCSECQTITQISFNFCPNCGADMRGE